MTEEELKAGWKYRAMAHTKLNHTQEGGLLLAVLGIKPPQGSRWNTSGCIINPDGIVTGLLHHKTGRTFMSIVAFTAAQFQDVFRKIADDLKLTDAERKEMFDLVRKWVQKDLRAVSDLNLWK
jgi:hypothetical protein